MTRTAYETDAWIPVGPYWDNEEGETGLETYDVQEFIREVDGGTVCRLLVFRSSRRREEFETRVQADLDGVESLLEAVTKRRFACEIDAERAMEEAKRISVTGGSGGWTSALIRRSRRRDRADDRGRTRVRRSR